MTRNGVRERVRRVAVRWVWAGLGFMAAGCGSGGSDSLPPGPGPFEVLTTFPDADSTGVSASDLLTRFLLSDPADLTTVQAASVTATVDGAVVPILVTASPDALEVDVRLGGVPRPGADVEVDLLGLRRAR